jgi:hypothetical protein
MAVWFARPRIHIIFVELPYFPLAPDNKAMNSGTVLSFAGKQILWAVLPSSECA